MAADDPISPSIDEAARERFERAWLAGSPRPIEEFLPAEERPEYAGTLEELVLIDLEFAWKAWADDQNVLSRRAPVSETRPATVEEYVRRFPRLGDAAIVERLQREEGRLRRASGDDFGEPRAESLASSIGMSLDDSVLSADEPGRVGSQETTRPTIPIEEFLRQLRECELLPAEELNALSQNFPTGNQAPTSIELAQELVRRRKLTAHQATALLQGLGASLVLGNYVILDKLGQGGMGMVYRAEHRRMRRTVALKVLAPSLVKSPDAVKRFHREVQAAARLDHANIVTAHDADQSQGTHFLVMQFIAGTDLASYVTSHGPLPADKAISCILQAAQGLAYAHERGVIHRDIKPANLLLSPEGTVKILDMGLARLADDSAGAPTNDLTGTGAIMGTIDYMAPEQAVDTRNADRRADIYSLGATLWYLLTGQSMFGGGTLMERLIAHRERPAPSLLDQRITAGSSSETLSHLDAVFRRMVAKRVEDRYQSMAEVIADLTACVTPGATPLSVSIGPSEETKLAEFLRQLEQEGGRGAAPATWSGTAPNAADPTAESSGTVSEATTRRAESSRMSAARGSGFFPGSRTAGPIWKHPNLLSAGAVALLVLLGLAVWSQTGGSKRTGNQQANQEDTRAVKKIAAKTGGGTTTDAANQPPDLALEFTDRSTRVEFDVPLPAGRPWTVEVWVCTPDDPLLLHNSPVLYFGTTGKEALQIKAYEHPTRSPKEVNWECVGYTSAGRFAGKRFVEALLPNTWYHVAAVVDNRGIEIFVNGKQAEGNNGAAAGARMSPNPVSRIGGAIHSKLPPFIGRIDEVRVSSTIRYTAAFTPQRRFTGDKDTLVLYHCDEGTGEQLVDSSGNNRHGRVLEAKWATAKRDAEPLPPAEFALQFNGTDYVEIPTLKLPPDKPFTLEAWVTKLPHPLESVFGEALLSAGVGRIEIARSPEFRWRGHISTASSETGYRIFKANAPALFQRRTHLALQWGGNKLLSMYIDGKYQTEHDWVATTKSRYSGACLGHEFENRTSLVSGGLTGFVGTLHRVRISSEARYSEEFAPLTEWEKDPQTVALYDFHEGKGDVLNDRSGNRHHGKIVGAKWVPVQPPVAPQFALDFSSPTERGFGRVDLPAELDCRATDPITVEMVVTATAPLKGGTDHLLWTTGELGLKLYGAKPVFTAGVANRWISVAGSRNLVVGERTHFAAVSSGKQLWIFVDGRLGETKPVSVPLSNTSYKSYIGGGSSSAPNHAAFEGLIDQIRISRGARYTREFVAPGEMQADSETLALYRFKEGAGDVLHDSSGNNRDGKIVGAKWVSVNGAAVDLDRRALERVFKLGGTATLLVNKKEVSVNSASELPFFLNVIGVGLMYADRLTDDDLRELVHLKGLTRVHVKGTPITNAGLEILTGLEDLQILDVSFTKVTAEGLSSISQLRNLTSLVLGNCPLTDAGVTQLTSLSHLVGLQLPGCRVTDDMVKQIAGLKKLRNLNLHNALISNQGIRELRPLTELDNLSLANTRITDECLDDLAALKSLRTLNLDHVRGITPAGRARLKAAIPELNIVLDSAADADEPSQDELIRRAVERVLSRGGKVTINIGNKNTPFTTLKEIPPQLGPWKVFGVDLYKSSHWSDDDLRDLSVCRNVSYLVLKGTQVTEAGLSLLPQWEQLSTLDLGNTKVTAACLHSIVQCRNLESLCVGGIPMAAEGLSLLADLPKLASLQVWSCGVTDEMARSIGELRELRYLQLQGNAITDQAVKHLRQLTELETMNIGMNGITDGCVDDLASLKNLRTLNVTRTKITPGGVARLKQALPAVTITTTDNP